MKAIINFYNHMSLIIRILIGMVIGALIGMIYKSAVVIPLFGTLFGLCAGRQRSGPGQ